MSEIFINNYISERKQTIKRLAKKELTNEEVEERLKEESNSKKVHIFLFDHGYVRDKMFDRDGFKFPGLIRYLKEFDCNCNCSFEFLAFIYERIHFTNLDIYEDLIEIADEYRGRRREDSYFYDSDESCDCGWLTLNEVKLEISKYIDDFIDKHDFKNDHDIRNWYFAVIHNYFVHIGIDIKKL